MNEPYFIEVETNPCPHCHKGRTWTIIGPDGGCAVGKSWSSDDEDECPEEAEIICEALNSAFREGQTIMVGGMVNRFLAWPLPQDFAPDCGISFDGRKDDEWNKNKTWPVGTNLLTAEQARSMLEHVIGTEPDEGRPVPPHVTGPAGYYPPPVPCPRCNPIGEFNGRADCENCNGIGLVPAETQPCFMCMGHGVTVSGHASAPKMKECSHCHGSGLVAKQQSSECVSEQKP